jgi:mRNA interferase RelE/StbE
LNYRLVYTHRAVKDIQRLELKVKRRIAKTLVRYSEDPFKYAE